MSAHLDRQILRLAIPNALSALLTPLIGIADTGMIGHLSEVAYLGAVATASAIFDVLYWSTGFLRMGTTSLVAQYFGAGDRKACAETLCRSLVIALVLGILMLVGQTLIAEVGFELAGGSPEVQRWGRQYFAIRILAAPMALVTVTLNGFFLGTANAGAPLAITLVAGLVNIGADYLLIFGRWGLPRMEVLGAAWAAVLGNAAAVLVGAFVLGWRYRDYLRQPLAGLFARPQLWLIFRTNANLFGRTLCLLFAQFSMLGVVSRLGDVPLAANAIVWQIWSLVSFAVDGFAHAAETLVGNSLGTREFSGARQVSRRILQWSGGIGGGFALIYLMGMEPIARIFTQHGEVVRAIASLTLLIAPIQPLNALAFAFDGIFIGANDMEYLFKAMALSAFGVFVPAILIGVYGLEWGIRGAWLAYDGLMVGRLFTLWSRYRRDVWLRTFVP